MCDDTYDTLVVDVGCIMQEIRNRIESISTSYAMGEMDVARIRELKWVHDKLNEVL